MRKRDIPRLLTPAARAAQRRVRQMRESIQGNLHESAHLSNAERRRQEEIRSVSSEETFRKLFNVNDGEGEDFSP